MKKTYFNISIFVALAGMVFIPVACTEDLLDQTPTTEMAASQFWKTEADATYALMGAYSSIRPVFDRDYYFDGQTEYVRVRNANNSISANNLRLGDAYHNSGGGAASGFNPSGYGASFDKMYRYLYGGVNRTNYVIENVRKMIPTALPSSVPALEAIVAEARLLRGMVYFRLISMWGDVPYIHKVINDNEEVASLSRTPIVQVRDSILADFTYASIKLPAKRPVAGRAAQPAALAFRGKLRLYWASWKNFGWPELDNFTQDPGEARVYYDSAAADFRKVITRYGLTLYRNGDPGQIDALGKADVLPNYFHLFMPAASNDVNNTEYIMSFNHGGIGATGQGEELMRDFSGRSQEGSQCWVSPRYEIADRYQLTATGEFAPPLTLPPSGANAATIEAYRSVPNSSINPSSYTNRDYRMKSTMLWDYEMIMGLATLKTTGFVPFIHNRFQGTVNIGPTTYPVYNTDGTNSGYVFRKFVRNYGGLGRSDGDFSWPVMRLADVYLMYAEATNEVNDGPVGDAVALVNQVRHRGNLPPLTPAMTADRDAFFKAIEQERIVELVAEGHRSFDLRRWRAFEDIWGGPGGPGVYRYNTWGQPQGNRYFQDLTAREYQQLYIFRIPPSERDRNPNLTQNTPWL